MASVLDAQAQYVCARACGCLRSVKAEVTGNVLLRLLV